MFLRRINLYRFQSFRYSTSTNDYYKILGVEKNANKNDIRSAYIKKSKKYHPDINRSTNANEKFRLIVEAYETLKHPFKRSQYDSNLQSAIFRQRGTAYSNERPNTSTAYESYYGGEDRRWNPEMDEMFRRAYDPSYYRYHSQEQPRGFAFQDLYKIFVYYVAASFTITILLTIYVRNIMKVDDEKAKKKEEEILREIDLETERFFERDDVQKIRQQIIKERPFTSIFDNNKK
ncbi:hypothetical protein SNEBB_001080 [Seison nebaliae]|nr:hypothetical protein SNEBB_001080 [Seison nebaliae]